jgi:hypothetical protein
MMIGYDENFMEKFKVVINRADLPPIYITRSKSLEISTFRS